MNPTKLVLAFAVPALLIGLAAGYFLGRATLEHQWADPTMVLSQDDASRAASDGADPAPAAGTRVLRPMPIQRARLALRELTAKDPLKVVVGSVGRDDTAVDLHLMLENHADCQIVAYQGVAYAFDAHGFPEPFNKHGEQFVAFASPPPQAPRGSASADDGPPDDERIAANDQAKVERHVNFPNHANVVLGQIDSYTCADGKRWSRN